MERPTALLAAGTVAGLVLFALLALGLGSRQASGSTLTLPWAAAATAEATATAASPATDSQLRAENAQLRSLLATMQAREATYREQLEKANQSLLAQQKSSVIDATAGGAGRAAVGDDDHDEHERDEHDEHERGEDDD